MSLNVHQTISRKAVIENLSVAAGPDSDYTSVVAPSSTVIGVTAEFTGSSAVYIEASQDNQTWVAITNLNLTNGQDKIVDLPFKYIRVRLYTITGAGTATVSISW